MKVEKIYEEVFSNHLLLLHDCKAIEAEHYLNNLNIRTTLRGCTGQTGSYYVTDKDGGQQIRYYIYLEKGRADSATIVHEASHLVFRSLQDCGIKIVKDTDEIVAYYLEWWFKKISGIIKTPSRPRRRNKK